MLTVQPEEPDVVVSTRDAWEKVFEHHQRAQRALRDMLLEDLNCVVQTRRIWEDAGNSAATE